VSRVFGHELAQSMWLKLDILSCSGRSSVGLVIDFLHFSPH